MSQKPLLSYSFNELKEKLKSLNMPAFRAKQIWEWIFHKFVFSYKEMTNISKSDQEKLMQNFPKILPKTNKIQKDPNDQTTKVLIELADSNIIETVAVPNEKGFTFCLSTQVGCPLNCLFCRTGQNGFIRNLTTEEILSQVLILIKKTGQKPTNIVYMGMGEPFLNIQALFDSIDTLTNPKGLHLATRRITVSTSGIVEGIEKLANRPGEVNLAVSLHAADNETRSKLMPVNKKYPLETLKEAIKNYLELTNRRVSFEVTLLKNINDGQENALNLIQFCEGLLCHINIIRFNGFKGSVFKPTSEKVEKEFKKIIKKAGIPVTIRKSKGSSILAACGQLSGKKNG